jgi:hypothetical protein
MISPKELKKLAAACRKAGIKTFKGDGFEFTLEGTPGVEKAASKQTQGEEAKDLNVESEDAAPTGEALLFWSAQGLEPEEGEKVQ